MRIPICRTLLGEIFVVTLPYANVQTRFNPAIVKAPYYRLKESYRIAGNVHSLILLNVGFDPPRCLQAKKIARALTNRFENRHAKTLFSERLNGLTEHTNKLRLTSGGIG